MYLKLQFITSIPTPLKARLFVVFKLQNKKLGAKQLSVKCQNAGQTQNWASLFELSIEKTTGR